MGIDAFLSDFFFPFQVAFLTIVIGFFITLYQEKRKRRIDLNQKRLTLIDSLLVEIGRLNSVFDNLQKDPDERQYFKYKNINSAKPSIQKMQSLVDEVIILSDENLRKRILGDVDLLASLVDDLSSLEDYALAERNKFKQAENELLKEFRDLKKRFLERDIFLNEENEIMPLNSQRKLTSEEKRTAKALSDDLNALYLSAKNENENAQNFCKDKRVYYTSQIIGVQGRLRELELLLNETRDSLTTKTKSLSFHLID